MAIVKFVEWGYVCNRCGHRWVPRGVSVAQAVDGVKTLKRATDPMDPGPRPSKPGKDPRVCPNCKSPYWNAVRQ